MWLVLRCVMVDLRYVFRRRSPLKLPSAEQVVAETSNISLHTVTRPARSTRRLLLLCNSFAISVALVVLRRPTSFSYLRSCFVSTIGSAPTTRVSCFTSTAMVSYASLPSLHRYCSITITTGSTEYLASIAATQA